ncbi:MAG: VOC family protein [Haloferacaceae archaeon]
MLSGFRRLGLEVDSPAAAGRFYRERLGLDPRPVEGGGRACRVGDATLRLRAPGGDPRGGRHVHYALSGTAGSLGAWRRRLADLDPTEHDFGTVRSLYVFDPDDNCVEVAATPGDADPALDGFFEVVLEVADLDRSERTYRSLGFDPTDRGDDRRRVRLSGPVDPDLELWEPQRGLAGARGGAGVDLAFAAPDPAAAAAAVDGRDRERVDGGVRVRDPDGHALTFLDQDAADDGTGAAGR